MKRALITLLVGLTILIGFSVPARAEGAPPPAGHCEHHYALSYIDCTSAGLRWISSAEKTRVDRVRCEIPSNYRVVCFNYTPYVVRVRVNMFTTNGLYVRYIRIPYTRKVIYSPAYINRITWRWWWA
jgi:hypothetical protein